jgi:hypothetical protein
MGSLLSSLGDGQIGRRRRWQRGRQQAVQFLPSDEGDGAVCRRYMGGGGWGFEDRFRTPACGGAIARRRGIPHAPVAAAVQLHCTPHPRRGAPCLPKPAPPWTDSTLPGHLRPRNRRHRLPYGHVRAVVRLHYMPCPRRGGSLFVRVGSALDRFLASRHLPPMSA